MSCFWRPEQVAVTLEVAELFERGDRLGGRLPRHPKGATQLSRITGAGVYRLQRELVTRGHPGVTSPVELDDDLVDHRGETTEPEASPAQRRARCSRVDANGPNAV